MTSVLKVLGEGFEFVMYQNTVDDDADAPHSPFQLYPVSVVPLNPEIQPLHSTSYVQQGTLTLLSVMIELNTPDDTSHVLPQPFV